MAAKRVAISRRIAEYIGTLDLVGGDKDGECFVVLPWERRFIYGAWSGPGDAALSVGRGNGKSALVAALASAVVDPAGPLGGPRREVVCVAASFEQSRIIFEDVLSFLGARYDLGRRDRWRLLNSAQKALLEYRETGARIRCIGSDPGRAHGLRPYLALLDEPAQWDGAKAGRMLAAIRTGLGKVPGSRLIALGTRPEDEAHWFARMLVSAPYVQVHAARPEDPPFWLRTVRRANPSADHLPSLMARIYEEQSEARIDPDALASYKALRLNMGVADTARSVLVDSERWAEALALPEPETASTSYVLGIDLGSSAAMSAAAGYWRDGRLKALACFPRLPGLRERGLADGVGGLYVKMAGRGELIRAGRRVSDIAELLREVLARWGSPAAVVTDRWRKAELADVLDAIRFPRCPLVVRGQGFKDGGEDVRAFRRALLGGHVRPSESLLLAAALREARVVTDPAGNSKLAKATQGGRRVRARDDAAAAAILAVAAGTRRWQGPDASRPPLRSVVV